LRVKTAPRSILPCFAFALTACGSDAGPAADAAGSGGVVVSGSGGTLIVGGSSSGGSGGSASGGEGGAPIDVFYASAFAETTVGESPALVRFQNDTKFTMTLWLEQAAFEAVPAGSLSHSLLASSAAVEFDAKTGKHIEDACVQFPLSAFSGPNQLSPGGHYTMSVALDENIGFVGVLSETSGEPFVGLRAIILDPSTNAFNPSALSLGSARGQVAVKWRVSDHERTAYAYAGKGTASGLLRFVSGDERKYVASEPLELTGAPGYTLVVDAQPMDDAVVVIALHAEP